MTNPQMVFKEERIFVSGKSWIHCTRGRGVGNGVYAADSSRNLRIFPRNAAKSSNPTRLVVLALIIVVLFLFGIVIVLKIEVVVIVFE